MTISIRVLGFFALGLLLFFVGSAQTAPQKQVRAVQAIINLSDHLGTAEFHSRAKQIVDELDSCDISRIFGTKKSGGAGIGSAVKAGHGDSIQHIVMDWSGSKAPRAGELREHRKDLLKMARTLQVMAELAPMRMSQIVSMNNEKRVAAMNKVNADFKLVTAQLRDAIEKADPLETRKAAIFLNQTCMNCHDVRDGIIK